MKFSRGEALISMKFPRGRTIFFCSRPIFFRSILQEVDPYFTEVLRGECNFI